LAAPAAPRPEEPELEEEVLEAAEVVVVELAVELEPKRDEEDPRNPLLDELSLEAAPVEATLVTAPELDVLADEPDDELPPPPPPPPRSPPPRSPPPGPPRPPPESIPPPPPEDETVTDTPPPPRETEMLTAPPREPRSWGTWSAMNFSAEVVPVNRIVRSSVASRTIAVRTSVTNGPPPLVDGKSWSRSAHAPSARPNAIKVRYRKTLRPRCG
jgi:hypothetical protein